MKRTPARWIVCCLLLLTWTAVAAGADAQPKLSVRTDNPEALYKLNRTVTFVIESTGPLGPQVDFDVTSNGNLISVPPSKREIGQSIEVAASSERPGFLLCTATIKPANGKPIEAKAGAAFAPEQIRPSREAPRDFWQFWEYKKAMILREPVEPKAAGVKSADEAVECIDVEVACPGSEKPLRGYLAKPKAAKPKSLPAIMFPHSAGVRSSQLNQAIKGAKLGCLALDFNAHGIENGKPPEFYKELSEKELKSYSAIGAQSRETSYFLGMCLRLLRAMDYVTSLPEWDGKTLIVYGSSQGGGQALIAAGLDDRVTLCLANVPAMCDQTAAAVGRTAGWPRMVEWGKMAPDTARYFDAVNFATRIKCPVVMTVGFIDQTCSPSSVYAAYNSIKSKKEIISRPRMGHEFPPELIAQFDNRVNAHIAQQKGEKPATALATTRAANPKADGYRGIWFELGEKYPHGDKYSGGLATYTANHVPIAIYAPQVNKTFFVYGGTTSSDQRHLLIMASYFDHTSNTVPRPTIVHDKNGVNDPHDNASLAIDEKGYLWVFVSGRARTRPGFIYRSAEAYSVESFERISEREITYPQPHFLPGLGFLHLFTKYTNGRELYWSFSSDGRTWSEDLKLAGFGGHYQVSEVHGQGAHATVGSAFMWHPGGNVNKRTNLYYAQTRDAGRTWTDAGGYELGLPLSQSDNPAQIIDYKSQGLNVYIHDLNFDEQGRPAILYLTSKGAEPGPECGPRIWRITRWTGSTWETSDICRSDHAYDTGSLYISRNFWTVFGPTEDGPQKWGTGGEMAMWVSEDAGKTWKKRQQITTGSEFNHSYARRPREARDPFYVFWADGDANRLSESRLYFADSKGRCYQLPYNMTSDRARPISQP